MNSRTHSTIVSMFQGTSWFSVVHAPTRRSPLWSPSISGRAVVDVYRPRSIRSPRWRTCDRRRRHGRHRSTRRRTLCRLCCRRRPPPSSVSRRSRQTARDRRSSPMSHGVERPLLPAAAAVDIDRRRYAIAVDPTTAWVARRRSAVHRGGRGSGSGGGRCG